MHLYAVLLFALAVFSSSVVCEESQEDSNVRILSSSEQEAAARQAEPVSPSEKTEEEQADEDEQKHADGSICYYCKYCKLCEHCDKECPCDPTASTPQCNLCKYCQYCHLCSSVCESVCIPGGFLDTVSSAIFNAFPPIDSKFKESLANDLDSVKDWAKQFL